MLLAFIGQVYPDPVIRLLAYPVKLFIAGLVIGGLAHITAYFTHLTLFNEEVGRPQWLSHGSWIYITLAIAVAGIGLFCWGAFVSAAAAVSGLPANSTSLSGRSS